MMLRFSPLPILSLFALLTLGVLIYLGAWQWRRFEAKSAARGVPAQIVAFAQGPDIEKAVYVFGVLEGRQGWRVFAPISISGQKPAFVDIAFWPSLQPPRNNFCFLREEVRGVWTSPKAGSLFRAKDDAQARLFYSIRLAQMASSVGLKEIDARYLAADYGPAPNPFVRGQESLPPERHLGYALTWWGLALGLVGMYLAVHVSRGRLGWNGGPRRQDHGQI